jgi:hypothetical protein
MKPVQEVGVLFDAKAPSWNAKYATNGPLAYRVSVFSSLLAGSGATVLDFGGGTGAIASNSIPSCRSNGFFCPPSGRACHSRTGNSMPSSPPAFSNTWTMWKMFWRNAGAYSGLKAS